jgi:hypothetical protein
MRRLLGFIFDNRDWFSLFFAVIFSLSLLSNNDSPNLRILRGQVNSVVSILFGPVNWVKGIGTLREENAALESRIVQKIMSASGTCSPTSSRNACLWFRGQSSVRGFRRS